jgi:hypothetical protein
MENALKIDGTRCVRDWIKIPDSNADKIPDKTQNRKKMPYNTLPVTPPVTPSKTQKTQTPVKSLKTPRPKRCHH